MAGRGVRGAPGIGQRLLWFVLIWAASVCVVTVAAMILRLALPHTPAG